MRESHQAWNAAIRGECRDITGAELDLLAAFWKETRFPIRHRYAAHFTQHTVQIDKTLGSQGETPGQSKRVLRRIYAAPAEAEGWMIGAESTDEAAILAAASSVSERTKEIRSLLET